ncbi:MAG: hypothetical protein HY687_03260 [Chloroflexi bacterium]|nr:hypothetical protein [Chloroflexota bacterium]
MAMVMVRPRSTFFFPTCEGYSVQAEEIWGVGTKLLSFFEKETDIGKLKIAINTIEQEITAKSLRTTGHGDYYEIKTDYASIAARFVSSWCATPAVEIHYVGQAKVESLLGSLGKGVLKQVIRLVKSSTVDLRWPLARIEVRHTRDPEIKDWEFVLLVLVFNCSFDIANRHLHDFYGRLDALSGKLSREEDAILQKRLYFDIEPLASVSAA